MTLLRDSVIVGAATFLIGSVLMEINVKQDGEPVAWWPYVGTFMSGALGFYLLGATNVVKVKNAEYKVTDGYEDCEVCAKTCDIKTDPLHDVQAGRICSDCHYLNEYGVEKCAESFPAFEIGDIYERVIHHGLLVYFPILEVERRTDKTVWFRQIGDKGKGNLMRLKIRTNNFGEYVHPRGSNMIYAGNTIKNAESFSAEGPTDDELETWSERQDDGSMLVTIDEDGESHTELTYKDGDLTELKRFMAEVFEADRKARRRTTLTWARGIEQGFGTIPTYGDTHFAKPRPYDNDQYNYDSQYSNDNAYHIKGLPPGFHIHLWKPPKRGAWWQAYLKSPNTDEWQEEYSQSKRDLMGEVLGWYNDVIAVPEETELTPIQQLMIGQGMISGEIQIYRVVPIPGKVQYYFAGGSESFAPTLFATYDGDLEFNTDDIPSTILHFCRGLSYIGVETAGNVRSVNRYNKDRKQWVSSGPAWFQNMCKEGINNLHFTTDFGTYEINGIEFLRFYGSRSLPENKDVDLGNDIERPMFQVRLPIEDGEEVVDDGWITPRPSTQRKMYMLKVGEGLFVGFENEVGILNKCVAKYQPQTFDEIHNDMLQGKVTDNSDGWGLDGSAPAGHIMCRRFKKK